MISLKQVENDGSFEDLCHSKATCFIFLISSSIFSPAVLVPKQNIAE